MLDLVGNPEDRFSRVVAQIVVFTFIIDQAYLTEFLKSSYFRMKQKLIFDLLWLVHFIKAKTSNQLNVHAISKIVFFKQNMIHCFSRHVTKVRMTAP